MQCKAKAKGTGQRCRQNALTGYEVCLVHGSGTHKRVREGTRKSPKTVSVTTGEHAQPETMELKKQLDPAYAHCYDEILRNPQLATLDEMANRIYASLLALDYQKLNGDERAKRLKSLAFAISKVEQTRTTRNAEFEKEQRLFVDEVKKVFYEFIPKECLIEAATRLRTLIAEMGDPAGDELVETARLPDPAFGQDCAVS